jgi:hypothetical protein
MVEAYGVTRAEAFPSLLEARQPDTTHINAAVKNTTLDFDLLVARAWVERTRPDLVVLHVFTGSDLDEMGGAYPCCREGPLLEYSPPGSPFAPPKARCPAPDFTPRGGKLADALTHSPPPYFLRALRGHSVLAAHALALFHRVDTDAEVKARKWRELGAVLRAFHDELGARHVGLLVDILPALRGLRAPDPSASAAFSTRRGVARLCEELGIDYLDAWELYARVVADGGASREFLPDELHFTPAGHVRMADFLAPQIETRLSTHGPRPDGGASP